MKFSIIVPFYNTNIQCFRRMIDSLRRQTHDIFEVIVVDDGSRKEFKELIDKFDYKDLNVKIVHQENKGLPGARNAGIKVSQGDYLVFVDSDDMLPEQMLYEANHYIDEYNNPDVIYGRMVYYKETDKKVIKITENNCDAVDFDGYRMSMKQTSDKPVYFSGAEMERVKLKILHQDDEAIVLGSSSANAYKRSVVLESMFDEDVRICEDQIFNRNLLQSISSCLIVPNEWYCYIQYHSSMLHDQSKDIDLSKTFSYWDKIHAVDENESRIIKHYSNIHNIGLICDEIKKMSLSGKKYSQCRNTIRELYKHSIIVDAMSDMKLYESNINKIKLFLLKNRFTRVLFTLYKFR